MNRKMKLDIAVHYLSLNIFEIKSVSDWAIRMGWDRAEFSRRFRKYHGESAKVCFHRLKLRTIENHFYSQPEAKYYEVAMDLGFRDEKALYDYVRYHRNCSPTAYKRQVVECEEMVID